MAADERTTGQQLIRNATGGRLDRIVSGGQTGVDRGALDAAMVLGIDHGGWCPRGRLSEDGPIAARYQLQETSSAKYWVRTRRNVVDSSGTLILCRGVLQGGTKLTHQLAQRFRKPCLIVDLSQGEDLESVRRWIEHHDIRVLNVAGPRESTSPGISRQTYRLLTSLLGDGHSDVMHGA